MGLGTDSLGYDLQEFFIDYETGDIRQEIVENILNMSQKQADALEFLGVYFKESNK